MSGALTGIIVIMAWHPGADSGAPSASVLRACDVEAPRTAPPEGNSEGFVVLFTQ